MNLFTSVPHVNRQVWPRNEHPPLTSTIHKRCLIICLLTSLQNTFNKQTKRLLTASNSSSSIVIPITFFIFIVIIVSSDSSSSSSILIPIIIIISMIFINSSCSILINNVIIINSSIIIILSLIAVIVIINFISCSSSERLDKQTQTTCILDQLSDFHSCTQRLMTSSL